MSLETQLDLAAVDDPALAPIAGYASAWNRHSVESFPSLFTELADFVTFNGTYLPNFDAIRTAHEHIFGGPFHHTAIEITGSTIKGWGDSTRAIRSHWILRGENSTVQFEQVEGVFLFVVARIGGAWLIVAAQNTYLEQSQGHHARGLPSA